MFERYTEKARRVIFFARYEASQFGSTFIETEHILLGLFREDRHYLPRVLPALNTELVRKEIEHRSRGGEKISTAVDIPLSNECRRVLAYAAEEAERLGHGHIGTEHLLLGLVREKESYAAEILRRYGASLENLRVNVGSQSGDIVCIHDAEWDRVYVENVVSNNRRFLWHKQGFTAPDVVVQRSNGAISFDRSLANDAATFEMVKGGWHETTCLVCHWKLEESDDDPEHNTGYTNGRDWFCCECYEKLFI